MDNFNKHTCDICLEQSNSVYTCKYCKAECCGSCLKYYLNNHSHFLPIQCFNCVNNFDLTQIKQQLEFENEIKKIYDIQLKNIELEYDYLIPKFLNYISDKYDIHKLFDDLKIFKLYELLYIKLDKWNRKDSKTKQQIKNDVCIYPILKNFYSYVEESSKDNYNQIKKIFKTNKYKIKTINRIKYELKLLIPTISKQNYYYHEFKKIYDWNKNNIYYYEDLSEFVNNEIVNKKEIKENFIQRCTECQKGIIIHDYKKNKYICNGCSLVFCQKCLQKESLENHKCNQNDLDNVKYLFEKTKACPRCGTRIEKEKGCDDMYCVYCKTGFKWSTNEIIMHNFHNPHRTLDIENKKNVPNLPDQLCSEFYIPIFACYHFITYIKKEYPKNKQIIQTFKKIYNNKSNLITSYEQKIINDKIQLLQCWLIIVLKSKIINANFGSLYSYDNIIQALDVFIQDIYNKNLIENTYLYYNICRDFIIETEQYVILHNNIQPTFDIQLTEINCLGKMLLNE